VKPGGASRRSHGSRGWGRGETSVRGIDTALEVVRPLRSGFRPVSSAGAAESPGPGAESAGFPTGPARTGAVRVAAAPVSAAEGPRIQGDRGPESDATARKLDDGAPEPGDVAGRPGDAGGQWGDSGPVGGDFAAPACGCPRGATRRSGTARISGYSPSTERGTRPRTWLGIEGPPPSTNGAGPRESRAVLSCHCVIRLLRDWAQFPNGVIA
jgi:hypothetical protein